MLHTVFAGVRHITPIMTHHNLSEEENIPESTSYLEAKHDGGGPGQF